MSETTCPSATFASIDFKTTVSYVMQKPCHMIIFFICIRFLFQNTTIKAYNPITNSPLYFIFIVHYDI